MDWTWYLFGFEGRINRAKCWLAALIIVCWMIFLSALTLAGGIVSGGEITFGFDTNDIFAMGGLGRAMPQTFIVFLIGTLSLAGIPFFGGFFSALYIFFLYRWLHLAPWMLGLTVACGGVGALAGAVAAPRLIRTLGLGPAILLTGVTGGAMAAGRHRRVREDHGGTGLVGA